MYLTVDYRTKDNGTVKIAVNLSTLASIGDCDGKKKEEGYNSVLYTANGHALYSSLPRETIVKAIQGREFTEEFIVQQLEAQEQTITQ